MAAIDFPASPTANQIFSAPNGIIYRWQASPGMWVAVGASAPGGDFFARNGASTPNLAVGQQVLKPDVVVTGNTGNWYNVSTGRYTPPAGRYYIFGALSGVNGSSQAGIEVFLYKNGVQQTDQYNVTVAAGLAASANGLGIFDANGTDYFELQVNPSQILAVSAGRMLFGAFPISGIKGPQGDPGQLGFRLIGTQTVSSAVPQVDFTNLPSDINTLMFVAANMLPVTNDAAPGLRFFDSTGTIDTTSNYATQASSPNSGLAVGVSVPATTSGAQTYALMAHNGASNLVGNIAANGGVGIDGRIGGIRTAAQRKFYSFASTYVNSAQSVNFTITGGGLWINAGGSIITGVRFLFNTGNIASGTFSLWGSP